MFKIFLNSFKNTSRKCQTNQLSLSSKYFKSNLYRTQNKSFFGFSQPNSNPNNKKFYEILDVDQNASDEDIKKSFRTKAMKFHPDRGGDPDKVKSN